MVAVGRVEVDVPANAHSTREMGRVVVVVLGLEIAGADGSEVGFGLELEVEVGR